MNTKKYEFVDSDTIEFNGTTLRRIRALRDIPEFNVKVGDLGGYLTEESSLSQDNNSWIGKNARIGKNACIGENSWIGQGVTTHKSTKRPPSTRRSSLDFLRRDGTSPSQTTT